MIDPTIVETDTQRLQRALRLETERRYAMPKIAEVKVGSRNREKSAATVELLFDWDTLLDPEGDFYRPMISKGLLLEEGEDYRILDAEGSVITLKSGPEKVRKLIVTELAHRLNVPTSVKVPETGAQVASNARDWVSFRPRIDSQFATDEAKTEYIEKNGGQSFSVFGDDEDDIAALAADDDE
jgi:hypothetical protein